MAPLPSGPPRLVTSARCLLPFALLLAAGCAASPSRVARSSLPPDAIVMGAGEQTYAWTPGWLQVPGGADLGNTHGEVVVDDEGLIHLNTDTEQAVMTFRADGSFVRSWGAEFANGLHGMTLFRRDGRQLLGFTHFNRHEWVVATLQGEVLERHGCPFESGLYAQGEAFRPTSIAVAPDGRFFVADGYGENWVHLYDRDGRWLRAIGGPGEEPGRFRTPHGIAVDTRGEVPRLLVADRENHRIQAFTLDGTWQGIVVGEPDLRRPCKIQQQGEYLVVPDLAGRVTILDGADRVVAQLGDNPDPSLRAENGVPKERWRDGEFLAPHSAAWDADGNLYVMDWNRWGRVNKLARVDPLR